MSTCQRKNESAKDFSMQWHSHNWRSNWSQASSSSSTQWWESAQWHDHHLVGRVMATDSCKPCRFFFTDVAYRLSDCRARDGARRQNTSSNAQSVTQTHIFSRVSLMRQITKRTCVWLKMFELWCTSVHLQGHPLTTCFIDHSLMCLIHFPPLVLHHLQHRLHCHVRESG